MDDVIISLIQNRFPEETWPWLAASLRQDELVWKSLQDPSFAGLVFTRCDGKPSSISPGSLALLALEPNDSSEVQTEEQRAEWLSQVERLKANLQNNPDPDLLLKAHKAREAWTGYFAHSMATDADQHILCPGLHLSEAGLLALALREMRCEVGNWSWLESVVNDGTVQAREKTIWKTTLACLYSLVPDANQMLQELIYAGCSPYMQELGLHTLLSNPLTPQETAGKLHGLLAGLPLEEVVSILRHLSAIRPDLAAEAARQQPDKPTSGFLTIDTGRLAGPFNGYDALSAMEQLLLKAEAHQIAGDPSKALPNLKSAWRATHRLQAELAAQLAAAAHQMGDTNNALAIWEQAAGFAPEQPAFRAGLAMTLMDAGRLDEARKWLLEKGLVVEGAKNPDILLARVRLASLAGEAEEARSSAIQFIETLEASTNPDIQSTGRDLSAITQLAKTLLDLGFPEEACRAARLAIRIRLSDPCLLALAAKALSLQGNAAEAVEAAQTAVLLAPDRYDLHKQLAGYLEAAGEWDLALKERTSLVEREYRLPGGELASAGSPDWRLLAQCALQAGKPSRAVEACEQAIMLESDDTALAQAHLLLGKATAAMGDTQSAEDHYTISTEMAPLVAEPWLALAFLQKNTGRSRQALDTLRSASQANPNSAEIYLALGEAYLEDWEGRGHPAPTQALAGLQRAANLIPADAHYTGYVLQVALRLGQTLRQLGHLEDARQVLQPAYAENQSHPELAYSYAQVLMALGRPRQALPALETALQAHGDNPSLLLDYARALIAVHEEPRKAIQALEQILNSFPDHAEAKGLMAEALAENQDLEPALQAYQAALETDLIQDPVWRSRLSLGLGRVALALQKPDIAIAALQEAALADPQDPGIVCTLSDAYDAAGLSNDAVNAARGALRLAGEDVETLAWFADRAMRWCAQAAAERGVNGKGTIGAQLAAEALNALGKAVQLAPDRTDLLIRLGKVQAQNQDFAAAKNTFQQVAMADKTSVEDLHEAALSLLELDDAANAARCLERAVTMSGGICAEFYEEGPARGKKGLANTLITAYCQAGEEQKALETLDEALEFFPGSVSLCGKKASLLESLGKVDEALDCLETATSLKPDDSETLELHYRVAHIKRIMGKLHAALEHIEIILASSEAPSPKLLLRARTLGAELAFGMLQPDQARAFLELATGQALANGDSGDVTDRAAYLDYICLRAEAALDIGEENLAGESVAAGEKLAPQGAGSTSGPRLLALQARLFARKGDYQAGLLTFEQSINAAAQKQEEKNIFRLNPVSLDYALAAAAVELEQWDQAMAHLARCVEAAPCEALVHLSMARVLVLRAEMQRLYQSVNAVSHAPGEAALSSEAFSSFESAIQAAAENERASGSDREIDRWRFRGKAVFQPGPESAESIGALASESPDPEVIAAHIGALRLVSANESKASPAAGQESPAATLGAASVTALVVQAARAHPQHPRVLIQLALFLALKAEHIKEAKTAARQAVRQLVKQQKEGAGSLNVPLYAASNALLGQIAFRSGDFETALASLDAALAYWPEEPRWHALAAEISSCQHDLPSAITHLEQAVKLEHKYIPHYIALGQVYQSMAERDTSYKARSVHILEKAARIAPEMADPWLALARTYQASGDSHSLEQAASCAERAVSLAPDQPDPLVVRAEIALQAGEYQAAYDRLATAKRMETNGAARPHGQPTVLLLARALDGLGRHAEALVALEEAIPQAEERLSLLLERVRLIRQSQGLQPALEALRDLAKERPDEPMVLANLAQTLTEAGQVDAAVRHAQKALQLTRQASDPAQDQDRPVITIKLEPVEQARLHHLLGSLLRNTGQLDQCIHHLNEAIKLAPQLVEPYLELGRAYQDRRQSVQALHIYNQATSVAPRDPRPYYHAGLALKEGKDYLGAETMLRRAADLAPNDISIHRQLGAIVALNLVHNRYRKVAGA